MFVNIFIVISLIMSSGRRSEPAAKRRRTRTRDSGSSSNGESSNVDRTRQPLQQQQPQQQRPASPPSINPASARPVAVPLRQGRPADGGDQIAPTSPSSRTTRRTTCTLDQLQVAPEKPVVDPIMHQVSSLGLPKESFKLCNTDFIWYVLLTHP